MKNVIVGCGSVIPDGDGRYLLVREAKVEARGRYALPAGKLEAGETLAEAAAREAHEEAGVEVEVERLLGIWHCAETSEGFAVVNFVFASRIVAGEPTASEAHPEVGWFTRAEVAKLAAERLLRGTHIELALAAYERGDCRRASGRSAGFAAGPGQVTVCYLFTKLAQSRSAARCTLGLWARRRRLGSTIAFGGTSPARRSLHLRRR